MECQARPEWGRGASRTPSSQLQRRRAHRGTAGPPRASVFGADSVFLRTSSLNEEIFQQFRVDSPLRSGFPPPSSTLTSRRLLGPYVPWVPLAWGDLETLVPPPQAKACVHGREEGGGKEESTGCGQSSSAPTSLSRALGAEGRGSVAGRWPGPPRPRSKPALRHRTHQQTRTHVLHPILRGGDRGGRHEGPRSYGVFASDGGGGSGRAGDGDITWSR